jgi:hypothetical protein
MPARTRSTIRLRSSSAMAPMMTTMARPSGPPVSICSRKLTNSMFSRFSSSRTSRKWRVERAMRSQAVLRIPGCLAKVAQVVQHVGQGVQVAAVLDFAGDDVLAGQPGDSAAGVGHQEVVDGALPAPHPGADRFLLDVLR